MSGSDYTNRTADEINPTLTGPTTPDTHLNRSTTPPATYSPGYRFITNPYGPGSGALSGQGVPTNTPQPEGATPTTPWPVPIDLVNAILAEVQTRYRLLAMNNLRPSLTDDEICCALYDAVDVINNYPPATQFTVEQLFAKQGDPRFRGVYYLAVGQKLLTTLLWDWTANGFDQTFNNFKVETKLGDYQLLQERITEQLMEQLKQMKEATQHFIKRVVPSNQSMIRTLGLPYRRVPTGRFSSGGGGW